MIDLVPGPSKTALKSERLEQGKKPHTQPLQNSWEKATTSNFQHALVELYII